MQNNRFASRRSALTLAVVFAAGAGLAACGTEDASAPAERKAAVANVRPGAQPPAASLDREHLAQRPGGWTDQSNGKVITGKMRLLLEDPPR